jgi:pimeloyl-ACP methyl ester carboxylesterase
MELTAEIQQFTRESRKTIKLGNISWNYYSLGFGTPILWLTGGLRRSALGFGFMRLLSKHNKVIAPDYPPQVRHIEQYIHAFDAILDEEKVPVCNLGGQSYGGLLAQAYLAYRPNRISRLILSSTGPADYVKAWLPVEYIAMGLAYLLPDKFIKRLLAGGLIKAIELPDAQKKEWQAIIQNTLQFELSRDDVISHFAVVADLIQTGVIKPMVFQNWKGRLFILSAENDITQSKADFLHYAALFGREVERVSLGTMGHAAALYDPQTYVDLLEGLLTK